MVLEKEAGVKLVLGKIDLPLRDFRLRLDVEVPATQVTAVFGPSGAGKSSLLDLVAGLRKADSARIEIDGVVLIDTSKHVRLAPANREAGYVPQDLCLFPHFTVRKNILYGAAKHPLESCSFEHVTRVLEIEPLLGRNVRQLSGGEKQRVALARALMRSPRFLLLDEPLASLDVPLKMRILPYLQRVRDEFGIPMLYVSHDADEVKSLADYVLVMERGRCVAHGAPGSVLPA